MKRISLKAARTDANLTRKELADKMGVCPETIKSWETGRRHIKTPNLIAFCLITGFNTEDIILPE